MIRLARWLKNRDQHLQNTHFAAAVALVLAGETALFHRLGYPFSLYAPVLALSAYVPLNFLFFCNVIGVGNIRELIWMASFIILCLASVAIRGTVDLFFVFPLSLALTIFLCLRALQDPYCRYRKGIRMLDEAHDPGGAVLEFRRAVSLLPGEAHYRYHLGRALIKNGAPGEGKALIKASLSEQPGLIESLRKDPLFRHEWID